MSVTTSFPGIYVQELPSNGHAISVAPTSMTVFVGYSHPFKTPQANFGTPIELFSFADYERFLDGQSPCLAATLPRSEVGAAQGVEFVTRLEFWAKHNAGEPPQISPPRMKRRVWTHH